MTGTSPSPAWAAARLPPGPGKEENWRGRGRGPKEGGGGGGGGRVAERCIRLSLELLEHPGSSPTPPLQAATPHQEFAKTLCTLVFHRPIHTRAATPNQEFAKTLCTLVFHRPTHAHTHVQLWKQLSVLALGELVRSLWQSSGGAKNVKSPN